MTVYDNEFLKVKPRVRLSPSIIPVIIRLDKFFEAEGLKAFVTSGVRTSMDQLTVIKNYCVRYGIEKEFPEILKCLPSDKHDNEDGGSEYIWQKAWSRLLNKDIIINPPFPAVVLFDYIRNGENKIGTVIGHSPHFFESAFDIGGGIDHDITNELAVVSTAFKAKMPGLRGYLPERKNNCVHCDCVPVKK